MHHTTAVTPNTQPHSHALLNHIIPAILRSPFHGLISRYLLLITFTGRKTGKFFTIPVTYLQQEGRILVFSDQRWWRNLRGGGTVTLRLRGRIVSAIATPVEDPATVVREVAGFLTRRGTWAAPMINVKLERRQIPAPDQLADRTQNHVVISIVPAA